MSRFFDRSGYIKKDYETDYINIYMYIYKNTIQRLHKCMNIIKNVCVCVTI